MVLQGCWRLSEDAVSSLGRGMTGLTRLDLGDLEGIGDFALASLAGGPPPSGARERYEGLRLP
jgi:hypothetical protein